MRVTLHGAAGGEVTGSAYLLETGRANVLIDCGLFQGAQKLENYNRLPKRGAIAELDRLNQSLKTPDPFVWEEHKSNPLVKVYEGYLEIRKAVELSVKHGLPMIYEC